MGMKAIRRRFVAGLAAILIMSSAGAEELGLQLYSLRNQMAEDLPGAFAHVASWDLKAVEGGGALYGYTVDGFRDELKKHGLSMVSVDTSYDELRDNPIAVAYKARFFGAEFATFYWIPHDSEKGFTLEDAQKTVEIMNKAGKLLSEHGITLQYHPHGYEFLPYEDGTLFDVMAKGVTEAEFQMDVFWIRHGGADPVGLLQKYPGRFKSLHLKDRAPGTPGSTDGRADVESNVVLGQGDVGIAAIVEEAKRQDIRYFFVEDESSRVLEQVPESLEFLRCGPK